MRPADEEVALEEARRWYATRGRLPSWGEWERADRARPSARTISRRWGWHSFWAAALDADVDDLFPPGDSEHPNREPRLSRWTDARMLEALVAAYLEQGTWPTGHQWARAAVEHPAWRTYVRRFGSWEAAITAARRRVAER